MPWSGALDRSQRPGLGPAPPGYAGQVSERAGYDDELLPEQTSDDTDVGWGEPPPDDAESADDERLRREKPPHW
jgi:hypothetical protein